MSHATNEKETQAKAFAIAQELKKKAAILDKKNKDAQTDAALLLDLVAKLGMDKIQAELKLKTENDATQKSDQSPSTRNHYDPFHSVLRFFNPNSSTNSYKGIILGPTLNILGKLVNFANDEDCEQLSRYFAKTSETNPAIAFPWKALTKVAASSVGALLRIGSSFVDWTIGIVTRPINTARNLWDSIKNPKNAINQINKHFQILEAKPNPSPKPSIAKANGKEVSIKTMTLNSGLLRDIYWDASKSPLNNLRRPRERATDLAEAILAKDIENPQDVVCLQEVFDNLAYLGFGKDSQSILIDKLKERFPYIVYDIGQRAWPMTGSGLMILSKHPIVDAEFHRYPNLLGIDTLSNKGFMAVKVQKGDRFFTAYNTHTQAGSSDEFRTEWIDQATNKSLDTVSTASRRSQELAYIEKHMAVWQTTPPAANPNLKYLDTVLMGDLNEGLENSNKIYGISHGKKPSRKAGNVKYPGKNALFTHLSPRLPDNFIDIKIHEPIFLYRSPQGHEYVLENIKKNKNNKVISGEKVSIDPLTGKLNSEPLSVLDLNTLNYPRNGIETFKANKGIHPLKKQLFEYTLSQLEKANPAAAKKLKDEVFWGSSINKETLIQSLPKDKQIPSERARSNSIQEKWENISELKLLDVNISRLAYKPNLQQKCGILAVMQYQSHLLHLRNKNNQEVTDHLGLQMEATYKLSPNT